VHPFYGTEERMGVAYVEWDHNEKITKVVAA